MDRTFLRWSKFQKTDKYRLVKMKNGYCKRWMETELGLIQYFLNKTRVTIGTSLQQRFPIPYICLNQETYLNVELGS